MANIFVLGPQRPDVNLGLALGKLGDEVKLAVISAGWQEGEGDLEALQEIAGRSLVELQLYHRAEALMAKDQWLKERYRERQEKLIELQRLYRIRLSRYMQAARDLLVDDGNPALLRHEQREAISQQRALDRHHIRKITAINAEFSSQLADRPSTELDDVRAEINEQLADCGTVLITGGNVAVLLNRLQLFDLGSALANKDIVAWSAGAMVLTDKIVLFHDNTPEGHRDAEVFNEGLGLIGESVFLPDAKHRLKTDDRIGVALFSRRFAPASCMALDNGAMLHFKDGGMLEASGVRRLVRNGNLRKVSKV
ncbi:MAG: Type 1 glutamine amidotransferase-like domain-containing protein [Woeseiaceae bacterium]|nr:Type 1 glutamine amidotransferase-like domain-containing protein [Woeseiaceae bacterium]